MSTPPANGKGTQKGGGFIPELDGLRGFAVLFVILHHFWPETGILAACPWLGDLGWIGVDLFFVISGFLITGILLDTKEDPHYFRNFYARRALRIFPLYYLYLAGVFIIPVLQHGPFFATPFVKSAGSPFWYLGYLSNIPESLLGKSDPPFLLAPLWSLAIEEQFYLSFPSIVRKVNRATLARIVIGLIFFAPMFRLVSMLLHPANERIQYLFTFSRLDVLAFGAGLALLFRTPALLPSQKFSARAALLSVIVFVVTFATGGLDRTTPFGRTLGYTVVGLTFAAILLWAMRHRSARATALLRATPLRYFGKLCYGLYLLHRPASIFLDVALAKAHLHLEGVPLLALRIAVSVGVATLSWNLFERPLLRFKKSFEARKVSTAPPVQATLAAWKEPLLTPADPSS